MSGILASVSSALAYATDLDDSSITVTQDGTGLILDGTTPTPETRASALQLARSIASCPVQDRMMLSS